MNLENLILISILAFAIIFGSVSLIVSLKQKRASEKEEEEFNDNYLSDSEKDVRDAKARELNETRKERKRL